MDSFAGKLAVVTGGASGMGRELVLQLAAEGCAVAACDLNESAARDATADALAGAPAGTRVTAHACDVADAAAVERFRDEVVAQHRTDHVDLLFNNAGIAGAGSFVADDRATWERIFAICWGGVYNCSRAFVPLLVASDEACLVNTSSVNGFWATHGPGAPSTAYGTAKFAVKGFSEALIEDFRVNAPHVKVAVVMPGAIGTGIGLNSALALGGDELGAIRSTLIGLGLPVEGAGDAELRRMGAIVDEVGRAFAPTSAAAAAQTILEAVRAGRWRVLVGDDAQRVDAAVRARPEDAYEADFPGLGANWFAPMLLLRGLFDSAAAGDLTATCELRSGSDRIAVRVAGGQLDAARGEATAPDAILELDPSTFHALVMRETTLDDAVRRGVLTLTGDRDTVERLLAAVALPARAA